MDPQTINERCEALKQAFAQELQKARKAMGLQRSEVAAMAGLSEQMVIYLEQGRRCPSLDSAFRLSAAIGLDLRAVLQEMLERTSGAGGRCGAAMKSAAFRDIQGRSVDFTG